MKDIKIYDVRQKGTSKVFFKIKDGEVSSVVVGNQAVSTDHGYQFYVDDYVSEQIEKCELYIEGLSPKLRLKEGEELEVPTEVQEKEKEIKALEKRLQQLKGEKVSAE